MIESRSAGGSSGGSAAAVAAGLCDMLSGSLACMLSVVGAVV